MIIEITPMKHTPIKLIHDVTPKKKLLPFETHLEMYDQACCSSSLAPINDPIFSSDNLHKNYFTNTEKLEKKTEIKNSTQVLKTSTESLLPSKPVTTDSTSPPKRKKCK